MEKSEKLYPLILYKNGSGEKLSTARQKKTGK